jgi:hypothetical protein
MMPTIAEQTSAWIALQRIPDGASVPDEVFEQGFRLNDFVHEDPAFAWIVIKEVAQQYSESELFNNGVQDTEAKRVLGMLGSGPLEDLLAQSGDEYIDRIEAEAKSNRSFFWTLACVWQNAMSDANWARVQRITGGFSP